MRADQRARRDAFLSQIGTRPVVMGVLNVTPDSFSDGGLFQSADAAVAHAGKMVGEGARHHRRGRGVRPGPAPSRCPKPTSSPASSRS